MRSRGVRTMLGYGAFAAAFTLFIFAWMKRDPGARIQRHGRAAAAQLPLSFEVNRGQAAADAKFVARGAGYAMLLTERGEPVLALDSQSHKADRPDAKRRQPLGRTADFAEPAEQSVLRLTFPGANPAPQIQGEQPLPGRSNYLIGSDPQRWLIAVPHYARVRYHEVFPGVDVLYYVNEGQLEYDFIVQPGSSSDTIRIAANGAQRIEQSDSGSLVLKTASGGVKLHKPTAYQQGPDGQREVACDYVLGKDELRFALGDYDRNQVLRIDPVLSYSQPLGALVRAIAVDAAGNSYLAGSTASANFPTTPGAFQPASGGKTDALIAKLDPTGSTLLFATYFGGSGSDSADSIALDSSGNVIVAGRTSSANLPINNGFQLNLSGFQDVFLAKLNPNGTQLLYSSYLGGSGTDSALGVAIDSSDRTAITGFTSSSNFPTGGGVFQAVYGGGDADAFIAKVDTTKSGVASLLFSTYLGGSNRDAAGAIAVDKTGNLVVTGVTISSNFPTANPLQASCASCPAGSDTNLIPAAVADAFVAKLNATGTALVYSTFLGGNMGDAGNAIALDSAGNAYVAGTTFSWVNFPTTAGAFQTLNRGEADVFVSKLNATGSALLYSSFIGGDGDDGATGIALDSSDNAYLTGYTNSTNYPTAKSVQRAGGGVCDFVAFPDSCSDAVVSQLNAEGSSLTYSAYQGNADINEAGTGIAVDATGNVYIAGAVHVASFTDLLSLLRFGPPSSAGNNIEPTGFAAKISPANAGAEPTSVMLTSSPNPSDLAQQVTFTAAVTPGDATGQVSFRDGGTVIGSASLSAGGTATFTHALLTVGSHPIDAEYLGDANFASSTSASLTQIVNSISLTAAQTSATATTGGTAKFRLTVAQAGALTSTIALSCSGLPAGWNCDFTPATVPAGSGPTEVKLTVRTSATAAQTMPRAPVSSPGIPGAIWLGLLALLMLSMPLLRQGVKPLRARPAVAMGVAALFLLAAGCASNSSQSESGGSPQSQAFTASFQVHAASGSTTASKPFVITVR